MDKYLEKMVLVPQDRWEQLLKNEKELSHKKEKDISEEEPPFPLESAEDKNSETASDVDDKKLAPPGIPTDSLDIEEVLDDDNKNYNPPIKKRKMNIKSKSLTQTFQWKKLP
jgi:hypothetical protein